MSEMAAKTASLMKQREEESAGLDTIPRDKPFFIRLDGSCFGTFVKRKPGFELPWDVRGESLLH